MTNHASSETFDLPSPDELRVKLREIASTVRGKAAAAFFVAACLAGTGAGFYGGHEMANRDINRNHLNQDDALVEKTVAMFGMGFIGFAGGLAIGAAVGGLILSRRKEEFPDQN